MELFGLNISKVKSAEDKSAAFTTPQSDDGAQVVAPVTGGAYYGVYLDVDGQLKSDIQQITKYREMSLFPEVDSAIQDIVNESVPNEDDTPQLEIILDELDVSDVLKEKIVEEFNTVLSLLNYNSRSTELFRRWYVDGRLFQHIIVDKANLKQGIVELRPIEATKIRKVKEVKKEKTSLGIDKIINIDEYFIYNEAGFVSSTQGQQQSSNNSQGIKISTDAVIYVPSGYLDYNTNTVLSYLQKAIRPANQLRMLEDATVVYFLARAPERRIFYVDVGNLPKGKAEQYVKDIMNRYRNKMVYDAKTGEVRDDKKYMCLAMDTKVPLLDGRTLSISEIASEYEAGEKLWAYSCDPVTGAFAPGLISWAGVTRKNAEVMKITLDNGKTITCTHDHKFPVWNKGFVRADELIVGESMIPHYTKQQVITGKNTESKLPYLQLFENDTKKWSFAHRLVSKWKDNVNVDNEWTFDESFLTESKKTIHHRDFNKNNNSPDNLIRMNAKDHAIYHSDSLTFEFKSARGRKGGKIGGQKAKDLGLGYFNKNHPNYHEWHLNAGRIGGAISASMGFSKTNLSYGNKVLQEYLKDLDYNIWFRNQQRAGWTEEKRAVASQHAKRLNLGTRGNATQVTMWETKERRQKHNDKYAVSYDNVLFELVSSCATQFLSLSETVNTLNNSNEILSHWKTLNSGKVISKKQKSFDKFIKSDIDRIVKFGVGLSTYNQLKDQYQFRNHKIAKIEYLNETIDTGCLTIDGDHIYHDNHTFALDAGIYTKNSMLEDFWMPRRDGGKGTEITTLDGASNQSSMLENVEYFKKKLFESLNVPISRMQPETGFSLGRSTEVSRDEVKFQKFVDTLRKKFSLLFYELLKTQLILKGVCNNLEWEDLKEKIFFRFQKDNFFSELKDQDILQARLNLLTAANQFVGIYFSKEKLQKDILKMTDKEIEEEEAQMKLEEDDKTATIWGQQELSAPPMPPGMGMQGDPGQDPNQDPYGAPADDGRDPQAQFNQ